MAGSLLSPLLSCQNKVGTGRKNWAKNYEYTAPDLYQPASTDEVQALVKKLDRQKALGSCHCFNDIADSPIGQISTQKLTKLVSLDEKNQTVTVESGVRYGQLAPELDKRGFALHNLASLPHISVAGACATATHGSGVKNGNLATAVQGLELVTPAGEVVTLNRQSDPELFKGAVVNLGALGVITKVTLGIQPTYQVRQDIFQNLPLQSLVDHFDEIMGVGYSVSLFTDWQKKLISQVWVKRRVEPGTSSLGADFFGAKAATRKLHPITSASAENCTDQLGVPGPWYERLPHFKMGFTPSSGDELQSEYFVSRHNAVDAFLALEKMGDVIFPQLLISEIRTIAADPFWMSPAHKQDSVAFHFTWKPNWPAVKEILPQIEAELAPFQARPHWGKLFTTTPAVLRERYEMLPEFRQLTRLYDPLGKCRNPFLEMNIYARY